MLGATCQQLGDRHPTATELVIWLVRVLCDIMTIASRSFSFPCVHHENTPFWYILRFWWKSPSIFPLYFRYIYFSLSILLSQNWWQDQFQYVLFPLLGIYLLYIISCLLWISSSNFAYIATAKSRASAENIGIKLSALPTSWPLFTAVLLRLLLGFIKTTDHQPTDPPTTYHLPTDPPTFNPPTYIKTEDQILNMFCTLQFLKMLTLIYFLLLLNLIGF